MHNQYAAIDPMALILPGDVYAKWVEIHHPHVPKVQDIKRMIERMSPEEQKAMAAQARRLADYSTAVLEAVGAR